MTSVFHAHKPHIHWNTGQWKGTGFATDPQASHISHTGFKENDGLTTGEKVKDRLSLHLTAVQAL